MAFHFDFIHYKRCACLLFNKIIKIGFFCFPFNNVSLKAAASENLVLFKRFFLEKPKTTQR